jgi:hypothetical protein
VVSSRGRVWAGLVALALALALPSVALAAGGSPLSSNPLSPGIPQSQAATPTTTTPPTIINTSTSSSGGGSLSGSGALVIAIAALVLIAGISFFIWRDARRRAPARHRAAVAGTGNGRSPGSKRQTKPRKLSPQERRRRKRGRARR